MSIKFLNNSLLTTFQDLGRNGFRRFGINPGGAMDKTAVRLLNILLGNNENEAVLEMHFPASALKFEKNAVIALGGADFSPELDGVSLKNWKPYFVEKGSVLNFRERKLGARCYLSVVGGFFTEKWLDSSSVNLKAEFGQVLKKNDVITFQKDAEKLSSKKFGFEISPSLLPFYSNFPTVRVFPGAEFESLTAFSENVFLKNSFQVTNESDRMGFRLAGEKLYQLEQREMLSSAVDFGTIQLLPNGQLIILMAEHQTTGGYPRIAQIISVDLPLVAQLSPNDKLAFHPVSGQKAESVFFQQERDFNLLKIGVKAFL